MEIQNINAHLPSVVPSPGQEEESKAKKTDPAQPAPDLSHDQPPFKASLSVDENDHTVIRVVDAQGNLVRQIPPEDYLKMMDILGERNKNLFHKVV